MKRILVAVGFGALALAGGPALAATELGGTTWVATNDACGIDEIDFSSDGTAAIVSYTEDEDESASWRLDGNQLSIEYENWYGGIEGRVFDGKRLEATETWRSEKTKEIHHDPCIFEID